MANVILEKEKQPGAVSAEEINDLLDDNQESIAHDEEEAAMLKAFSGDDDGYQMPSTDTPSADDLEEQQNLPDDDTIINTDTNVIEPGGGLVPEMDYTPEVLDQSPVSSDEIKRLEARLRTSEAKYGTLNSLVKELQERKPDVVVTPADKATEVADKTTEVLEDTESMALLEEEFPEFANAMKSYVAAQTKDLRNIPAQAQAQAQAPAEVADNQEAIDSNFDIAVEKRYQERLVTDRYPNWRTDTKTEHFTNWVASQDITLQNKVAKSYKSEDILSVLDMYRQSNNNAQVRDTKQRSQKDRLRRNIPATIGNSTSGQVDLDPDGEKAFLSEFNGHG